MDFKAILKSVRITGKGAALNLEVTIDDLGTLEGIQALINDWVAVNIKPFQLSISDISYDED